MLADLGVRSIQIYSDEWKNKNKIFKQYFIDLLSTRAKKNRIYSFDIRYINSAEASTFLDNNHYLGKLDNGVKYYVGAHYTNTLIGVWTFSPKSKDVIEWSRACWSSKYKTFNPHQKILNWISPTLVNDGYATLISFSDNRLHTGKLYENLGFSCIGQIKPDYMYTNGCIRLHKFRFRVKAGLNEQEEAKKKNFYRIYDCGKTKWAKSLR